MCAYNLFRHRDERHLACAVPENWAVPGFIAERNWAYDRKFTEATASPTGFNAAAATKSVQFTGFYLFQTVKQAQRPGRSVSL